MSCRLINHCRVGLLSLVASAVLTGGWFASPAGAEEPAAQFLEALREEGLFDLAHEYLTRMEKSPAASQEFRETIQYEQGLTLMAVSRSEADFDERQKRLDEAQAKFREFLTAQKNHEFAPKAKNQLANVLVERARVTVSEAERARNAADKPALMKEARAFYEQALKEYESSREDMKKILEGMPKALDPQRDEKRIAYRDELRREYVGVQMVEAVILYEMSDTAVNKMEKNEMLKKAADKYGEIYTKYRRLIAGLYSLLQQGKCYQEMGGEKNIKEALTYYQELLEQPTEPQAFRVLRTKTLVQTLQCWLSDDIEERMLDAPLLAATEWVGQIRPNETNDADWLQLYYELSRAAQLKLAGMNPTEPTYKPSLAEANRLVDHGIKYADDPLKTQFIELKALLGGKVDTPDEKPDPQTFPEAFAAGTEAWRTISNTSQQIDILNGTIGKTKDAAEKEKLQAQLKDTEEARKQARIDAIEFFRKALELVEPDTSLDELNLARFYLCSLHWSKNEYMDAAVYGEFLARYFPGHRTAKYTAIYARASYQNMYNQAPDGEKDFASDGVVRLSKLMLDKWAGDKEAEEALLTLIKFMVIQKNLPEARKYLAQVPLDSETRGDAEITTGQAMWSTYLTDMKPAREMEKEISGWLRDIKAWEGGEQPPEGESIVKRKQQIEENRQKIDALTTQLEPLKVEAQTTLKNGIERMKQSDVDKTLAAAVAILCRIYVEADQPNDAIALMEDPKIGSLTLVKKNDPAVDRDGMAAEVYTTALLAYFGALPDAANAQSLFTKAEATMDGLNSTVGKDEQGQQKLIGIYVTLAEQVKEMIERAPAAKRKTLTQVFATFLDRVAKTGTDFPVLSWVAENFYQLGQANDPGGGEPPADVKAFYAKAEEQYTALIEKGKSDESVSTNMVMQLRVRLANVLRRQGKYVLAMDQMEEVLKDPKRNSTLDLQVAAAEMYMEWAESELGIDRLYLRAINGGRKNAARKNNIWGWVTMSKRLAAQIERSPELKDRFYETLHTAKVKQAESYYNYAMTLEGKERKKFLDYARQDIFLTVQGYPDMGGSAARGQYDKILRDVQTALNQPPVGLEEFESTGGDEGDETVATTDSSDASADGEGG